MDVVCGEGNGGNGVDGKGEVWVVGSVPNTIEFECVRFKIQKIANEVKVAAKATIVIGIGKTVVAECRIHTIKANFYKVVNLKTQYDVLARLGFLCNGYTRKMQARYQLFHE